MDFHLHNSVKHQYQHRNRGESASTLMLQHRCKLEVVTSVQSLQQLLYKYPAYCQHSDMDTEGGHFHFALPTPLMTLAKVFGEIKAMQKDNLNPIEMEGKDEKTDEEIKGLKFIARKIKILLEKNKKI